MKAQERKKIEVLRNYIEKALFKTMEIEEANWKIQKINSELTKMLDLIDEL